MNLYKKLICKFLAVLLVSVSVIACNINVNAFSTEEIFTQLRVLATRQLLPNIRTRIFALPGNVNDIFQRIQVEHPSLPELRNPDCVDCMKHYILLKLAQCFNYGSSDRAILETQKEILGIVNQRDKTEKMLESRYQYIISTLCEEGCGFMQRRDPKNRLSCCF